MDKQCGWLFQPTDFRLPEAAKPAELAGVGAGGAAEHDGRGKLPSDSNSFPIALRTITCKTILNCSSICDYTLNCYVGCTHGCGYCYARFMQRFRPHEEPWGKFVDIKANAVEALYRQLRRVPPGKVFVSSACDGWQPVENEFRLTRECCRLLLERDFQLRILTKSSLVSRDFDLFVGKPVQLGVTITTLDERLARIWEPGAASPRERLDVLRHARELGLNTVVMFGPLLPYLADDVPSLRELFETAAQLKVKRIWVDALNRRPKVWPAVARTLAIHFPELQTRYRSILFEASSRQAYLAQLARNVELAAKLAGTKSRVEICF